MNNSKKLPLAVMSSAALASIFSVNFVLATELNNTKSNLELTETGNNFRLTGLTESTLKENLKNSLTIEGIQVVELSEEYKEKTNVKVNLGEDKASKEYIVCYITGEKVKESELKIVEEKIKTGKEGEIIFVTDHRAYFILVPYSDENLSKLKQNGSGAITETEPSLSFSDPYSNTALGGEKTSINSSLATYVDQNGIEYKLNHEDKTATLVKVIDKDVAPAELTIGTVNVNGVEYSVRTISLSAFEGCKVLKNLVVESNVETVLASAFKDCSKLETLEIGAARVNDLAFYGCANLKTVTIKDGVKTIGKSVFRGCNIKKITIPNSVKKIDEDAFMAVEIELPENKKLYKKNGEVYSSKNYNLGTELLYLKKDNEFTEEVFDNINRYEVSGIYNSGFKTYVQDGIRYVRTGKDTARVIDKDKTGIKNLEIPKVIKIFEEEEGIDLNITEIGELVFNYYSGLETIKIPNSVKIIDRKAFSGCKDLKEVVIESDDVIIHSMAFASCPSLEKLTIKGLGTKKVLKHAFFDSPKIELLTEYEYEDVKMLNSETAIEITREEFLRGPKTDVEMRVSFKNGTPYTENNIKYKLYDNKTAVIVGVEDREQLVEVLEIPELVGNNFTVTTISTKAFEGCQNLKKIVIPKTVREIGEKAFLNCNGVIDIIVSGDIEVIKPRTFEQCMKLKTVSFDGVVGQISKDAFYYCTELTEVYLKSDGTISKGAFSACSKIKIELPGNKAAFKDESGIEIYGEEDDDESFSNGPSQDVYIRDKR